MFRMAKYLHLLKGSPKNEKSVIISSLSCRLKVGWTFISPRDISEASQQNSVAAFSYTADTSADFLSVRGRADNDRIFIFLVNLSFKEVWIVCHLEHCSVGFEFEGEVEDIQTRWTQCTIGIHSQKEWMLIVPFPIQDKSQIYFWHVCVNIWMILWRKKKWNKQFTQFYSGDIWGPTNWKTYPNDVFLYFKGWHCFCLFRYTVQAVNRKWGRTLMWQRFLHGLKPETWWRGCCLTQRTLDIHD